MDNFVCGVDCVEGDGCQCDWCGFDVVLFWPQGSGLGLCEGCGNDFVEGGK
jgi:hypothetical protein